MESLYRPLAAALNRGIRESASARALCQELEGRSLAIRLDPPGIRLRLAIHDGTLVAGPDSGEPADASLAGSVLGFHRLVFGDAADAIRRGDVQLGGDTDIAERFQALLNYARPDPEEELSRLVGDVAAHQLGEAARSLAGWARDVADSFSRSLAEYLQEERRDLPTRFEMDEFLDDVDRLANDVDRAAARLKRLTGDTG